MADLMPEEKEWLIEYCMESEENTLLALEIGQVQVQIRERILGCFLKKLDLSIKKELEENAPNWKTCVPKTNLDRWGRWGAPDEWVYVMTMENPVIRIGLYPHGEGRGRIVPKDLFVGTPEEDKECPQASDLARQFKEVGFDIDLKSNSPWIWWFYLQEDHRGLEELSTLQDEDARDEEIVYFTKVLVQSAAAVSKALENQGGR